MESVITLLIGLLSTLPVHPASAFGSAARIAQGAHRDFSQAELALLSSFEVALTRNTVREATHQNVLRQIRMIPPVAFVEGYWVTPLDLAQVFEISAVRGAIEGGLSESALQNDAVTLLHTPSRLKQLTAFAFSTNALRDHLAVPDVGDFGRIATSQARTPGVFIAPVKDVEWAVVERVPPHPSTAPAAEVECYFFCGDPMMWDFDRDGVPNRLDGDDDGDGVADTADAYPYWPGASSCPCDAKVFIGFTETFSAGITRAALSAYELAFDPEEPRHAVVIGPVPGSPAAVRMVFPVSAGSPTQQCPDSTDARVRYVETDPRVCAVLRFRCRVGETLFSDPCGCGCKR